MKKSIMPSDERWSIGHIAGYHKHHVFGGANRNRSESDGLFIWLAPEMHNMSDRGIHFNQDFMDYAHHVGQVAWMNWYEKTEDDFRQEYGRSFLKTEEEFECLRKKTKELLR